MSKYLVTAAVFALVISFTSATGVGDRTCTSDTNCTGGSPPIENSVCNAGGKCECAPAYKENSGTCVAKVAVADTGCTSNGKECSTIPNSNCGASSKCQCDTTHKQGSSPNIDTCVPKAVSELSCTSGGKECDVVTNSACVQSNCQCTAAYKQGTGTAANTCVAKPLSEITCSTNGKECDVVAYSACVGSNCQCTAGYKAGSGTAANICVAKGLGDNCGVHGDCSAVSNSECLGTGTKTCTCKTDYTAVTGQCSDVAGLQSLLSVHVAVLLSILALATQSRY